MKRFETRGPEVGTCNLCGAHARLTDDHIPPKGVPRVGQAHLMELVDMLGADRPTRGARLFQSGVKYRSICRTCNNERLGGRCDPALVQFCQAIHAALGQRLYLPIDVTTPLNRVVRGIVGHLLAHDVQTYRRGEVLAALTDYFNEDSAPFPERLQLHAWLYPYNDQVITKAAAGFFDFRYQQSALLFLLIKFYPVGFLITDGVLPPVPWHASRLDPLLTPAIDDVRLVRLSASALPPHRWPEAPSDHGAIIHTRGAAGALRGYQ